MQFFTLLPLALVSLVAAQTESSAEASTTETPSYSNDATTLLTQTDSNGVITGQPTQPGVILTQPGLPTLITSQPSAAIVPAGFTSGTTVVTAGNSTYTAAVTVMGNSTLTSLVRSSPTPTSASGSDDSDSGSAASGTRSGSGASSSSTSSAAAAANHIKAGMGALAGAAGFFAIFV